MWGEQSNSSQDRAYVPPCEVVKSVQMEKFTEVAQQLAMQAWGFREKQYERGTPKPKADDCWLCLPGIISKSHGVHGDLTSLEILHKLLTPTTRWSQAVRISITTQHHLSPKVGVLLGREIDQEHIKCPRKGAGNAIRKHWHI